MLSSGDLFPPWGKDRVGLVEAEGFADLGGEEAIAARLARRGERPIRRVSGVASQRKLAAVRREDGFGSYVLGGLRRLFRQQVNAVPLLIILPVLHDGEVKAAELLPDRFEMGAVPAVAAAKDLSLGRQEGETGPLSLVLLQEAAGKMLRRQNMHLEIHRDFDFREPIFFVEPHCIKAPLFKVRADAKGADDLPDLQQEGYEARIIQMISVIVGQQENVDGREIFGGADIAAGKLP